MSIMQTVIQGGGTTAKKYSLWQRIKDDNNADVGIVVGFVFDDNNQEYAVIALDAKNRSSSSKYMTTSVDVSGASHPQGADVYKTQRLATPYCDLILGATSSPAISFCREKTFLIDGVSYSGQLPTLPEVLFIAGGKDIINNLDPTATDYPSLVIAYTFDALSCLQYNSSFSWVVSGSKTTAASKTTSSFVFPILEIPNN